MINQTKIKIGEHRILTQFLEYDDPRANFCKYSHHPIHVKIWRVGESRSPVFDDVIGQPISSQPEIETMRDAISAAFSFARAALEKRRESDQELSDLEFLWYKKRYNKKRAIEEY